MKLLFKIIFVTLVFIGVTVFESSLTVTAETAVSLSQLDSDVGAAAMRNYGSWRNYSFLLYGIPVCAGLLVFRKEMKDFWKEQFENEA